MDKLKFGMIFDEKELGKKCDIKYHIFNNLAIDFPQKNYFWKI
jgi:hypothetical protein